MATPVTLKTQKALLTRYTNNPKRLLSNCDAITAQLQTDHLFSGMTAAERRDTELLQEQLRQATNQTRKQQKNAFKKL
ncbi:hypothetical protein Q1695_008918 [Nippostrongylus brasiliensis]|nr:hypothetical protein Q1695_008918 [Nippostrongylus brasiliensis]